MGAKSDGVILFLLPSSLCLPSCLLSYLTTNILGPGLLPACSVRGECSDAESRALPQCMMLPPVHSLNQHKVRFSPAHRAVSPVEGPGSVSSPSTTISLAACGVALERDICRVCP